MPALMTIISDCEITQKVVNVCFIHSVFIKYPYLSVFEQCLSPMNSDLFLDSCFESKVHISFF